MPSRALHVTDVIILCWFTCQLMGVRRHRWSKRNQCQCNSKAFWEWDRDRGSCTIKRYSRSWKNGPQTQNFTPNQQKKKKQNKSFRISISIQLSSSTCPLTQYFFSSESSPSSISPKISQLFPPLLHFPLSPPLFHAHYVNTNSLFLIPNQHR